MSFDQNLLAVIVALWLAVAIWLALLKADDSPLTNFVKMPQELAGM